MLAQPALHCNFILRLSLDALQELQAPQQSAAPGGAAAAQPEEQQPEQAQPDAQLEQAAAETSPCLNEEGAQPDGSPPEEAPGLEAGDAAGVPAAPERTAAESAVEASRAAAEQPRFWHGWRLPKQAQRGVQQQRPFWDVMRSLRHKVLNHGQAAPPAAGLPPAAEPSGSAQQEQRAEEPAQASLHFSVHRHHERPLVSTRHAASAAASRDAVPPVAFAPTRVDFMTLGQHRQLHEGDSSSAAAAPEPGAPAIVDSSAKRAEPESVAAQESPSVQQPAGVHGRADVAAAPQKRASKTAEKADQQQHKGPRRVALLRAQGPAVLRAPETHRQAPPEAPGQASGPASQQEPSAAAADAAAGAAAPTDGENSAGPAAEEAQTEQQRAEDEAAPSAEEDPSAAAGEATPSAAGSAPADEQPHEEREAPHDERQSAVAAEAPAPAPDQAAEPAAPPPSPSPPPPPAAHEGAHARVAAGKGKHARAAGSLSARYGEAADTDEPRYKPRDPAAGAGELPGLCSWLVCGVVRFPESSSISFEQVFQSNEGYKVHTTHCGVSMPLCRILLVHAACNAHSNLGLTSCLLLSVRSFPVPASSSNMPFYETEKGPLCPDQAPWAASAHGRRGASRRR